MLSKSSASDADIEQFTQSGCWEFAEALRLLGMELAVLAREYRGEPSYEHAFALDGGVAVDVEGRRSLDNMIKKWQRYFSDQLYVIKGAEAEEVFKDVRLNSGLIKTASGLIASSRGTYLKKAEKSSVEDNLSANGISTKDGKISQADFNKAVSVLAGD